MREIAEARSTLQKDSELHLLLQKQYFVRHCDADSRQGHQMDYYVMPWQAASSQEGKKKKLVHSELLCSTHAESSNPFHSRRPLAAERGKL